MNENIRTSKTHKIIRNRGGGENDHDQDSDMRVIGTKVIGMKSDTGMILITRLPITLISFWLADHSLLISLILLPIRTPIVDHSLPITLISFSLAYHFLPITLISFPTAYHFLPITLISSP